MCSPHIHLKILPGKPEWFASHKHHFTSKISILFHIYSKIFYQYSHILAIAYLNKLYKKKE